MCGIVGFIQIQPILDHDTLLRMRDTLVHRGPDSAGIQLWNSQAEPRGNGSSIQAGLGHRRLAIIDLTEAGYQPMANEDGTVWITYNGEFYNFGDYRTELQSQGHVFRSKCDTETILHLYESYGIEKTLSRLNGMFAFGLYDTRQNKLLLARDRTGQKPLYYARLPDGGLIFASEMKALLASGFVDPCRLDPIGTAQFWMFGYTHGARTVYEQIQQLPAGHWAEWTNGRLAVHEYWDCPFGLEVREEKNLDSFADELEALLCDAIRIRLISDVPIGLFLSGGIDSSLIAALTAKALQRDLRSYTVAFQVASHDESPYAAAIARHLGIQNEILSVTEEMKPFFSTIARHFDMPFGDSSCIPTYFVSRAAKKHATVVLTGDAGDELFGGYDRYLIGLRILAGSDVGRELTADFRWRWILRLKLFGARDGFALLFRLLGSKQARYRVFAGELLDATGARESLGERRNWHARVRRADLLAQMQYLDFKAYLADDIMVKVDRMSMAHALECRSPLLDYRIIEFASTLPRFSKIDESGKGKRILKHLLARYIPERLFLRPKQGFAVPWAQWCDVSMRQLLRNEWKDVSHPWLRPDAGSYFFPAAGPNPVDVQWSAYSWMQFVHSIHGGSYYKAADI